MSSSPSFWRAAMVSSILIDGYGGCPSLSSWGGADRAAARRAALPRPWGVGAFRGRRLGASIGPLWLSALQGQAALGLRLPDLSRREARVSRARARGESSLAGPKKPVQPERD